MSGARGLLLAAAAVSLALWYIPGAAIVLYPLRLLVTTVHEGGHAVMALLTGGSVVGMEVHPDSSGVTYTRGGLPFLVYMAGYLGATLCGAAFLQVSRMRGRGRIGLLLLAAVVLLITLLWQRPWGGGSVGFFMGLAVGGLLVVAARVMKEQYAAFLLAFLSVQLCLNALFDVRNLLWLTTHTAADNDAKFMAQAYGLTPWFWAILWAACAAAILGAGLRSYWRNSR